MEPIQERLASNVRRIAEERGIALTHLPDRAGVGRSHFWGILAGKHFPSLNWIAKVAAALEVDPVELLRPQPHEAGSQTTAPSARRKRSPR